MFKEDAGSVLIRYGLAVAAVVLAALFKALLVPLTQAESPFLLFFAILLRLDWQLATGPAAISAALLHGGPPIQDSTEQALA